MNRFDAETLFHIGHRLERSAHRLARRPQEVNVRLSDSDATGFRGEWSYLKRQLSKATLGFSVLLAKRVIFNLKPTQEPRLRYLDVGQSFKELQRRIEDELKDVTVLRIPAERVSRYRSPLAGWERVIDKFPSVRQEITEASKCSALGQTTAVVFHLMRIMESGLEAIARDLKIRPKVPGWNAVLAKIDSKLNPKPAPKRRRRSRAHGQFIAEAAAQLRTVKDAWRNPVMHKVENVYDDTKADEIYAAVLAFMKHLATRLREVS